MDALSAEAVRARLPGGFATAVETLRVVDTVTSTNSELMNAPPPASRGWHVLIAREQVAGRGRSGNAWQSPMDGGLWMSAAHTFDEGVTVSGALTLAVGASVASVLRELGVADVGLKWPNDLIVGDRKLGGILVELASAGRTAVFGIGINFRKIDTSRIDDRQALEPAALESVLDTLPCRADLAGAILGELAAAVGRFGESGLAPFAAAWTDYDWLRGKAVRVRDSGGPVTGIAAGIGDDGSLLVERDGETVRVVSGTVRTVDDIPAATGAR